MVHVALDKELVTIFSALCNVSIAQQVLLMLIHPAHNCLLLHRMTFLIAIRFEIDAVTLQLEITFNNIIIFIFVHFVHYFNRGIIFLFIYKINLNKNLSSSSKQAVIIYFFPLYFASFIGFVEITQQWEFMRIVLVVVVVVCCLLLTTSLDNQ